jgi:hypothetical protein
MPCTVWRPTTVSPYAKSRRCSNFCATCIRFRILDAPPFKESFSNLHELKMLDIPGYQSEKLQAGRVYAVELRCERVRAILQTRPQGTLRSHRFQPLGTVRS